MKNKLFLLSELLRRDLTARYGGSFAGPLWAILNPAVFCALNAWVFAFVIRMKPPPGFQGGYVEFLLAGLLPWLGVQEAILRATTSISDQAHLVKKMRFPVHLLTASAVGAALVVQAVCMGVLTGFLLVTGRGSVNLGLLATAFAFECLLLAGAALVLASLNVFFRDLAQLLPPVLMIAFYLSPIIYPESLVPAFAAPLFALNPLRDLVALFRCALFASPPPPPERLAAWSAGLVMVGFLGVRLFRRCRASFADLL